MAYETVLVEDAHNVRTITLHRPEALNAFNATLHHELADALKAAERDRAVRCLVITGAGRAFCAGQDLKERLGENQLSLGDLLRQRYNPLILRIRTMEKPIIAAVNGVAAGAGCTLALACDLRVASDKASFVAAFVRVGLIPDSGCTFFMPRLLGLGKALELTFTGDALEAGAAQSLGMVSRVVPGEELMATTMELAQRLAQAPTRAIGLTKRAMNRALSMDLEAALAYETDMQELAGRTHDHKEGVQAFVEKRPPQFQGE
jgi:2-(1,2-epoxy-1,2-dihydrophenyl)acetyl-CoA isomerase